MVSRRSGYVLFAVALLASLAVHLPVYEVLGVLRDRLFAEEEARRRAEPIEFELTLNDTPSTVPAAPLAVDDVPLDQVAPADVTPERSKPQRPVEVEAQPKPDRNPQLELPKPKPEPQQTTPTPPTPPTPPPPVNNRQSVIQRSQDPNVEPPPDAKYLAEQNQRVEEETAATVTNMQEDSAETQLGAPRNADQEAGEADETELADTRDVEGEKLRIATPEESQRPTPPQPSESSAGSRVAEANPQSLAAASQQPQPSITHQAAGNPTAGGTPDTMVINDGFGTITVPRPRPQGQGAGTDGGQHREGDHALARGAQRGIAGHAGGPLNITWSQFEQAFGSDQLRQQREAYAEQRRSKTRGGHSEREWTRFRSAIENFLPSVRPGNQTALNAAAAPFSTYLVMVHERIHREYAFKFIRGLSLTTGPFADPSLFTELEIVFNKNGTVHRIGVVKPSGFLPFDFGAYNAVMRAQPYPEAPASILSGDGRVYVHWGFYRNDRQCGTFNASPFILPNPPGTPGPTQDPLRDVVPQPSMPGAPTEVPPDGTYGFNTHR